MSVRKTVVFDLGYVLVDLDWSRAVNRLSGVTAIPREEIIPRVVADPILEAYETGRAPTEAFLNGVRELLQVTLSRDELADIWTGVFVRNPIMETLFQETAIRTNVAILSDTNPLHWNYLRSLIPVVRKTERAVVSHELGSRKPSLRNYQEVAARCEAQPADCLFLDDKDENVIGAQLAGMSAFRFTTPDEARRRIDRFLSES